MNRKVCEPPWIKLYWHEIEDFADITDEQILKVCRAAQKFFRKATRANGDESKIKELVGSFKIESNPLLSAFARTINQANEQSERNRENIKKRWKKNGVPNAEPAPLVDDTDKEERKPYGAKKNVMLSDSDVASIRNAYPEATDKDFRIAVDRVSLKWSGKFERPASWTKSVSGAVEQILIARRDEKYYQQKEGFRKEREERKAEKTKMIEGVRNSLNFEPQEKPTVPDEFEVPF